MSHIFRDPSEGVAARRADLLRRRRDELVMMPHAIRRVFVARRARIAASLAIAAIGGALLAVAAKPTWAAFLAKGLPGINPAILCTLLLAMWIIGLFAYFAARAVDEHRFAVAMSKLVLPGQDIDADVERLSHENPDQAARDMAHRLEVRSSAWPVLASAVLIPVTALYVATAYRARGWPVIAEFESLVAEHASQLLACSGAGAVLAIAMTKRAARLPIAAPLMVGAALICAAIAAVSTVWLVPPALLLIAAALVVRRLRVEREMLQAEDPAAGSEIFTIRGFARQLRASGSAVLARMRTLRWRRIIVAVTGAMVVTGGVLVMMPARNKPPVRAQTARLQVAPLAAGPAIMPSGARSMVEPLDAGRLKITLDLVDDNVLELPALAGLAKVPPLWMTRARIQLIEGTAPKVSLIGGDELRSLSIDGDVWVTSTNCSMSEMPFGLRVQGAPGHYALYVEPVLTPAACKF